MARDEKAWAEEAPRRLGDFLRADVRTLGLPPGRRNRPPVPSRVAARHRHIPDFVRGQLRTRPRQPAHLFLSLDTKGKPGRVGNPYSGVIEGRSDEVVFDLIG